MTRCSSSLFLVTLFGAAAPMFGQQLALLPMPREVAAVRAVPLANGLGVVCSGCDAQDSFAASDLQSELVSRGIRVASGAGAQISLMRADSAAGKAALASGHVQWSPAMNDEGYAIVAETNGIDVVGATAAGVFYGVQTAKQLVTGGTVPLTAAQQAAGVSAVAGPAPMLQLATVRDWPAMKYRGLHDDLSRGPVPTLEFQKREIRTLASLKVNVYSPYFEHTMQYTQDPLASPPGGAMTAAQARELVAYATQFHVTVIPEQEAFGHLHYLLNWEMYNQLAETPHGNVLAPSEPGSLPFTQRMFTELATIYPSPMLHIGGDETIDLGKGKTKPDVDARGLGAVYLDYMQKIVMTLKPLNRKLLFWGDIAMHDPALVKALPQDFKNDTIAVAWEYNPQPKGFGPWIKPFSDAGMECWVAPGVNNWSRVWPNFNNALPNIQQFTAQGQASGCTGQLNTIWRDDGEALANNDWYALVFGAEAAWHSGVSSILQFQNTFGQVFHGDQTGKINEAQKELMAAHQWLKDNFKDSDGSDLLFWVDPWSPDGQISAGKIRPYTHDLRMHAERALVLIAEARAQNNLREQDALDAMELGARRLDMIGLKFQLTDEMATTYADAYSLQTRTDRASRSEVARDLGLINAVNGKLQDMRNNYALLRDLYEAAWLKSNRPYFLRDNLGRYDYTLDLWFSRIDKVRSAQRQWGRSQTIPSPAEIGMPPAPTATGVTQ